MQTNTPFKRTAALAGLVLALFSLALVLSPVADARPARLAEASTGCPVGWVPAPVPGGCLPENLTTENPDPIEAALACPDGFVLSKLGCVPTWYTTEDSDPVKAIFECPERTTLTRFGCIPSWVASAPTTIAVFNCPDKWVPAAAGVGACQPGFFTAEDPSHRRFDCPKGWVPAPVPGGCQPGFIAAPSNDGYIIVGVALCPEGWVPASVPGGCQPGRIKVETADQGVHAAQHHCAFGSEICAPMVEAIKALGGGCVESTFGVTCELPDFPADED